jgi:uncharacterized protein
MLTSLGRIQNPWVRSLTAAITAGAVVTMAAAIALGVTSAKENTGKENIAKEDAAYRAALIAAFVGAGCGAVFGLVYPTKSNPPDRATWKDWRNFVVVRKVKESEEITSFYLRPEEGGDLPKFQPGQFLTIKLDIPGQPKPVIRTYSLSDYAEPCEFYRLSIKREPMPAGSNFMPGIASNFMHDRVQEGSIIPAKPPSGKFVLDLQKSLPAVLISNGVGITPMISMAKAATLINPQRSIWFVHGARDGQFHAFRDEVAAMAQQNPNLHVHFAYSRPQPEDTGHYHSTGYVDTDLIRSLVSQEAEYFLCGSPGFMQSLREGLKAAGVPDSQVFFEAFTKGIPTRISTGTEARITANPNVPSPNGSRDRAEVVFAESGKTVAWRSEEGNLLDFAEANDLNPPYSCRQGICGTCMCQILEGEVDYQEPPVAAIDEGSVLICIAQPKTSRVVLAL